MAERTTGLLTRGWFADRGIVPGPLDEPVRVFHDGTATHFLAQCRAAAGEVVTGLAVLFDVDDACAFCAPTPDRLVATTVDAEQHRYLSTLGLLAGCDADAVSAAAAAAAATAVADRLGRVAGLRCAAAAVQQVGGLASGWARRIAERLERAAAAVVDELVAGPGPDPRTVLAAVDLVGEGRRIDPATGVPCDGAPADSSGCAAHWQDWREAVRASGDHRLGVTGDPRRAGWVRAVSAWLAWGERTPDRIVAARGLDLTLRSSVTGLLHQWPSAAADGPVSVWVLPAVAAEHVGVCARGFVSDAGAAEPSRPAAWVGPAGPGVDRTVLRVAASLWRPDCLASFADALGAARRAAS